MPLSQMPDTRIALSGAGNGASRSSSPFGTLGQLMQIKEQQAVYQQREQQQEQERRAMEDDDAIRSTLPKYERPDEAIDDLYRQGRATAAAKLGTSIYNQRKAATESYDAQVKSMTDRMGLMTQMLQGVHDDAAYQSARRAVIQMGAPVFGPGIADQLPTVYDQAKLDPIIAYGTKRADQLTKMHNATSELQAAYRDGSIRNPYAPGPNGEPPAISSPGVQAGGPWSKAHLDAQQTWTSIASKALSAADTQEEVDQNLKLLHSQGAPDEVLQQFPRFDIANPAAWQKQVADVTLSAKEKADIQSKAARDKVLKEQGDERNRIARDRAANANADGTGGRGSRLTAGRQSEVDAYRNKANAALEKEYREDTRRQAPIAIKKPEEVAQLPADQQKEYAAMMLKYNADSTAAREDYIDRKLRIENDHRNESGQPSLEEAAQAAIERGDRKAYELVAKKYNALTGGFKPLSATVPWTR